MGWMQSIAGNKKPRCRGERVGLPGGLGKGLALYAHAALYVLEHVRGGNVEGIA